MTTMTLRPMLNLTYEPIVRNYPSSNSYSKSNYVSNASFSKDSINSVSNTMKQSFSNYSSKAAFDRSFSEKKYWDELLEKLRKGGGGGGGSDSKFDRIAVSMMLTNFLNNKTIQAMLRNFNEALFNSHINNANNSQKTNANYDFATIQKFVFSVLNFAGIKPNNISNTINNLAKQLVNLTNQIFSLLSGLSLQLNKLQEVLEEKIKELIRKLDLKEKLKKIKATILDFFVDLKDELLLSINEIKLAMIDFFKEKLQLSRS